MTMCKSGILLCNLFISILVFSSSIHLNVVVADEDVQETSMPIQIPDPPTGEESHLTLETNVPNLTGTLVLPTEIPTESPRSIPFTQTHIFYDTEPSTVVTEPHSDSLILGGMRIQVQKCCQPHQVLELGQFTSECVERDEHFDIDVFYANKTHYWNLTTSSSSNVTVVARNPCTQSKYVLDPENDANDTFHVLFNSSLYVPSTMDMLSVDDYCVDIIVTPNTVVTTAVICTPTPKTDIFHYLYGTGFIISVISLILLAVYSWWRTDINEDHKKCLVYFAGSMALFFLFIAISTFGGRYFSISTNIAIAYISFYFNLQYFIWLSILCYDTYRCVQLATDDQINRKSFMKRYRLIAFVTPLLILLINLIDRLNPAIPNLYLEFSYSSSFLWVLFLFYLPTLISACINIYIMCSIVLPKGKCKNVKDLIDYLRDENWKPSLAPEKICQLKNMYRRTLFLCILIILLLVFDLILFFLPSSGEQKMHILIRSVIYCLEGFFVSSIFIRKNCFQRPEDKLTTNGTEMKPLNGA